MQPVRLNEYIIHVGETGNGIGAALIWTASSTPPSDRAWIRPDPNDNSALVIEDIETTYILPRMDQRCRVMALELGLHILWQPAGATKIEHRKISRSLTA